MSRSASEQEIQLFLEDSSDKDLLTGPIEAAGTLTFYSAIYTDIKIIIMDTPSTSAVELTWDGFALCAGAGAHALAGKWTGNPVAGNKVRVQMVSAGIVGGGTNLFFFQSDGSDLGTFLAGGLELGACVLNEEFDVKRLNSVALSSSGGRGVGQGTSQTDFMILDNDPTYGQKQAPVIKDFDSSDGDILHFGGEIADSLPSIDELEFKVVQTSKELIEASEEDLDFVYYEPLGFLYHDQNSEASGFGSDGGVIAVLDGGPNLNIDSFHVAD